MSGIWCVCLYNGCIYIYSRIDTDGYEFLIVSLDNKQWQFEANSSEDRDEWVAAIEQQILNSLQVSIRILIFFLSSPNNSARAAAWRSNIITLHFYYPIRAMRLLKWTWAVNSVRPVTARKTCRASGREFPATASAPTAIRRTRIGPVWTSAYSCASNAPACTVTWVRTYPKCGR